MANEKYNGMKRARDWIGKRVELVQPVKNGYFLLPAGCTGTITEQAPGGLTFEADACACCKVTPRITQLGYHGVRLVTQDVAPLADQHGHL